MLLWPLSCKSGKTVSHHAKTHTQKRKKRKKKKKTSFKFKMKKKHSECLSLFSFSFLFLFSSVFLLTSPNAIVFLEFWDTQECVMGQWFLFGSIHFASNQCHWLTCAHSMSFVCFHSCPKYTPFLLTISHALNGV